MIFSPTDALRARVFSGCCPNAFRRKLNLEYALKIISISNYLLGNIW